jgi:hypothetical protein
MLAVQLATAKARRRRALQNTEPSCRSAISPNTFGAVSPARREAHVPWSDDGGDDTDDDEEEDAEVDGAEAAAVGSAAVGAKAALMVLEEAPTDAAAANAVEEGEKEGERADREAEGEEAASVLVRIEATLFVVGVDTKTESSKLSCNSAS